MSGVMFFSVYAQSLSDFSKKKKKTLRIVFVWFCNQTGSFLRWIHESSSQLKERGFEQSSKVWSGMEIIEVMEKQGITSGTFLLYFVSDFHICFWWANDSQQSSCHVIFVHFLNRSIFSLLWHLQKIQRGREPIRQCNAMQLTSVPCIFSGPPSAFHDASSQAHQ